MCFFIFAFQPVQIMGSWLLSPNTPQPLKGEFGIAYLQKWQGLDHWEEPRETRMSFIQVRFLKEIFNKWI